jgi:hypothetical protein
MMLAAVRPIQDNRYLAEEEANHGQTPHRFAERGW